MDKQIQNLIKNEETAECKNPKDIQQLTIKLEPFLRARMITLIEAGYYSSYNEMIRDALRHLMEPYKDEINEGMDLNSKSSMHLR